MENLPTEILLKITEFLNLEDWATCLCVNRKFRDTALLDSKNRCIEFLLSPVELKLEFPWNQILPASKQTTNVANVLVMQVVLKIIEVMIQNIIKK